MNSRSVMSAVVFDLGGVLIDWDPRHLYRQMFADPQEMEVFLRDVVSPDWNAEQDAGRTWAEATAQFIAATRAAGACSGAWPESTWTAGA